MKTVDVTVIGSCILCEFCNQELVDDWNSGYVTCLPIWASKGAKVNGEEISIGETSLKQHMVNTHVMEPFAYRKLLGLGSEHPTPLVARWNLAPDRYNIEWHYTIELSDDEAFDASKLHFIRVDEPDFQFMDRQFMSEFIMYGDRKIEANEQNEFMLEDYNNYNEKVYKRLKKIK